MAAAAYVGASAWAGRQIRQHYEAQTPKLAKQLPFLKITEDRHEGGLLSSTHTMTLRLGCLPQREADGSTLWHGFVCDITEQREAQERLLAATKRFALARRSVRIGLWDWDLRTREVAWGTGSTS